MMYNGDQVCVKVGTKLTDSFTSNQGVKQGCILSPLLFNIFLSDLGVRLEKPESQPVEISPGEALGCLIWADDLLILSQTEKGLNNMLKELKQYSEENGLKINMDKTQTMIFNKTGRHMRRDFYLGDLKVKTTREYKYLGFKITPSGEITSGLRDLRDRALKAYYKLKNKLGPHFRDHPEITLKLFNTLIKPILLYASDLWGTLKLPKNNPFDKLHLRFCKELLGVQIQTTNSGVLLELGQLLLEHYAIKNSIKNWARIAGEGIANDLIKKSYNFSLTKELSWAAQIKLNLSSIGMLELFVTKYQSSHVEAFQRMTDIFYQDTFAEIAEDSSKLRTFSTLKHNRGIEKYLISNIKQDQRIAMTKLRLSNHELMIEKGRHLKVDRNLRFCPFCPTKIESEKHLMLNCRAYKHIRDTMTQPIVDILPLFPLLTEDEKFIALLSDELLVHISSSYVHKAFEIRRFLTNNHKNNE